MNLAKICLANIFEIFILFFDFLNKLVVQIVDLAEIYILPALFSQNIDFRKVLEINLLGVENVPTSLQTIFKLSRGPQLPHIAKSINTETYGAFFINLFFINL